MTGKTITVKVSAGAKREEIKEIKPNVFTVRVREVREKGRANERVREVLSNYLHISKSRIRLVRGATYKEKVFSLT